MEGQACASGVTSWWLRRTAPSCRGTSVGVPPGLLGSVHLRRQSDHIEHVVEQHDGGAAHRGRRGVLGEHVTADHQQSLARRIRAR